MEMYEGRCLMEDVNYSEILTRYQNCKCFID